MTGMDQLWLTNDSFKNTMKSKSSFHVLRTHRPWSAFYETIKIAIPIFYTVHQDPIVNPFPQTYYEPFSDNHLHQYHLIR